MNSKQKRLLVIVPAIFTIVIVAVVVLLNLSKRECGCGGGIKKTENVMNNEFAIVMTEYGQVRGRRMTTLFEKLPYYSFKGIPYARPPLGDLRFKAPQRPDAWNVLRDAFEFGDFCVQIGSTLGSEDCLYLNVYTPDVVPVKQMPVLVVLHGGAFMTGSGNNFGPDFLLNHENIVMVTFNYRVGPLGFLTLHTPEYSGNMGLKDQLLAIKWVKDNIHNFGGDSKQTTLYGFSAGSTSAHMHLAAPASKGLFQRVIMASGVATQPYVNRVVNQLPKLYQLANEQGVPASNLSELISFIKTVDPVLLTISTFVPLFPSDESCIRSKLIWVPCAEPEGTADPFLSRSAAQILSTNFTTNVDAMFGFASHESYFMVNKELRDPTLLQSFDHKFQIIIPYLEPGEELNYTSPAYLPISEKIRTHYFGSLGKVNNETLYEYTKLVSDIGVICAIDRAAKTQAKVSTGKTYLYRFSVDARFNLVKNETHSRELRFPGATHGDEITYLFGCGDAKEKMYNSVPATSVERRIIYQFSQIFANFIVHGDPTPGNRPVDFKFITHEKLHFLDITNEGLIPGFDPNGKNVKIWEEVTKDYKLEVN